MKLYFYENVKREGYRLVSVSEFGYREMSFVEKEGPTKNVIVDFQKYHSHIGGHEIKDSIITLFFFCLKSERKYC